jgi:hypothetical protein
MKLSLCILSALVLASSVTVAAFGATDDAETPPEPATLADELRNGFYSRINLFGFGFHQSVKDSPLNPGNALMIPRNQVEIDARPDFNLKFRRFEFGLKPRFQYARENVSAGGDSNTVSMHHYFVNEGFARVRVTDRLLAIYGRENLQWGPSALLSPSNPFNANNGKNNPYVELPGLDFARLVAIPNSMWTASLIANTGAGRLDQSTPFEKTYAAKVDYTGDGHFFSLISSHREKDRSRLGFFGGWNVSEALLLYTEGTIARRSGNPPSARNDYQLLLGGAYTLETGATVTGEFFYNNSGCVNTPIAQCLALQTVISDPRHPLLRRRYALLQYVDTKIRGNLNLIARLIRNIDDNSSQLVANLEYELGRHWQLYLVPTLYSGGVDSEFGGLLRRSVFVGASYTF